MFTATTKSPFFALNPTVKLTTVSCSYFFNLGFRSRFPIHMELIRKFGKGYGLIQLKKVDHKVEVIESSSNVVRCEDVFDAVSAGAKVPPDHLVIMVNGIVGSAADWKYAAKQFVKRLPDKVIVHCSECNSSTLTFDGVDRMGERLADEVVTVVKRWPEVSKISFVAHSLGGLVARYAVGRLYECFPVTQSSGFSEKDANNLEKCIDQTYKARIAGVEPVNFITVATPHLGSRGHRQLPILCGLPFLERRASETAHLIVGRSGKHLFLTDNDDGKPPLLLQMVKDSEDIKFMSALGSFKRRVAYANANYDQVVGWRTSSIRRQHELPESNLLVKDEKYPHIVYIERETDKAMQNGASNVVAPHDMEEEMVRGLTRVPWERVDVSFQESTQRYIAHSTIQWGLEGFNSLGRNERQSKNRRDIKESPFEFLFQVKSYWLNSDGADVVLHMIDNFLI